MPSIAEARRLAELEAEVSRLEPALRQAKQELREARIAAAEFHVGDVIEAQQTYGYLNREWRPAIVKRVVIDWRGLPAYSVSFQNKGGEWSKVETEHVSVRAAQ